MLPWNFIFQDVKDHEKLCWYGSPTSCCKPNTRRGIGKRNIVSSNRVQARIIRAGSTTGKHLGVGLTSFSRVRETTPLGDAGKQVLSFFPTSSSTTIRALQRCGAAVTAVAGAAVTTAPGVGTPSDREWLRGDEVPHLSQAAMAAALLRSHRQHRQLPACVFEPPRLGSPSHTQQCQIAGICQSLWNLIHLFKFILRINPSVSAGLCKSLAWLGIWGNLTCRSNSGWLLCEQFAVSCWLKIGWEIVNNV